MRTVTARKDRFKMFYRGHSEQITEYDVNATNSLSLCLRLSLTRIERCLFCILLLSEASVQLREGFTFYNKSGRMIKQLTVTVMQMRQNDHSRCLTKDRKRKKDRLRKKRRETDYFAYTFTLEPKRLFLQDIYDLRVHVVITSFMGNLYIPSRKRRT